jgi:hypothetical protein
VLYNLLQTEDFDISYYKKNKMEIQAHLIHDIDQSFFSIWARAISQKNQAEKHKRCHNNEEYKMTYKLL